MTNIVITVTANCEAETVKDKQLNIQGESESGDGRRPEEQREGVN